MIAPFPIAAPAAQQAPRGVHPPNLAPVLCGGGSFGWGSPPDPRDLGQQGRRALPMGRYLPQARRRARLTAGPELVRLRKEIDDVPVALAANDYRRGMARP